MLGKKNRITEKLQKGIKTLRSSPELDILFKIFCFYHFSVFLITFTWEQAPHSKLCFHYTGIKKSKRKLNLWLGNWGQCSL